MAHVKHTSSQSCPAKVVQCHTTYQLRLQCFEGTVVYADKVMIKVDKGFLTFSCTVSIHTSKRNLFPQLLEQLWIVNNELHMNMTAERYLWFGYLLLCRCGRLHCFHSQEPSSLPAALRTKSCSQSNYSSTDDICYH